MNDLKLYGKNDKEIDSLNSVAVQRRYTNGIWHLKMCRSIAVKRKKNKVGRNSTTEWRGNR